MNEGFNAAMVYFNIGARHMVKERGALVCHTDTGRVKLAKTNETTEAITRAHAVKEYLAAAGFTHTDRYTVTPAGLPYVQIGTDTFILTRVPEGLAVDFSAPEEATAAAQALARFHDAARGYDGDSLPTPLPPPDVLFKRGAQVLANALKHIRKQKQRSDFDILLVKNAPRYEARIAAAAQALAAAPAVSLEHRLCHNAIKEEHFLCADAGIYMLSFTHAGKNTVLHDLALLLRHCPPEQTDPILEAYNKITPLPPGAAPLLHALLLYPANFIKIVNQYYAKKRTWTPVALIKRLEEEVRVRGG